MGDNTTCFKFSSTYKDHLGEAMGVYPNPATSYIYLHGFHAKDDVQIFSVDGQLRKRQYYDNGIDVSSLVSGIYLIKRYGSTEGLHKFVKR